MGADRTSHTVPSAHHRQDAGSKRTAAQKSLKDFPPPAVRHLNIPLRGAPLRHLTCTVRSTVFIIKGPGRLPWPHRPVFAPPNTDIRRTDIHTMWMHNFHRVLQRSAKRGNIIRRVRHETGHTSTVWKVFHTFSAPFRYSVDAKKPATTPLRAFFPSVR